MVHAGGRPLKFQTEKEFVEYITINIDKITKDFFNDSVKSLKIDQTIQYRAFGANKPRIDMVLETTSGKRIGIECKNPKQAFHETSRSISQLLSYAILADEVNKPFDVLALITSDTHNIGCKIVDKYNLPIRIFYVDREVHGELKS